MYKTTNPLSGKYYVGRHSTKKLNDNYQGSGLWVRSSKKKGTILITEILQFVDTEENLLLLEKDLITKHIKDLLCMNLNENSIGFSSTNNPAKTEKERARRRQSLRGPGNGFYGKHHTEETKQKIREKVSGENNGYYGKKHSTEVLAKMSLAKKGKKLSKERCQQISDTRKRDYANGKRNLPLIVSGELHPAFGSRRTESQKKHMSEQRQNCMFITNEIINKRVSTDLQIPDGWRRGMKLRK